MGYLFARLLITFVLPLVVGLKIGRKIKLAGSTAAVLMGLIQALLICFALTYAERFLSDAWMRNAVYPNSSWLHVVGPDWPENLFSYAMNSMWSVFGFCSLAMLYGWFVRPEKQASGVGTTSEQDRIKT